MICLDCLEKLRYSSLCSWHQILYSPYVIHVEKILLGFSFICGRDDISLQQCGRRKFRPIVPMIIGCTSRKCKLIIGLKCIPLRLNVATFSWFSSLLTYNYSSFEITINLWLACHFTILLAISSLPQKPHCSWIDLVFYWKIERNDRIYFGTILGRSVPGRYFSLSRHW